jgi:hypothetical protein
MTYFDMHIYYKFIHNLLFLKSTIFNVFEHTLYHKSNGSANKLLTVYLVSMPADLVLVSEFHNLLVDR